MNNKNSKKLIELVQQNPELPIIPATHWEVVTEEGGKEHQAIVEGVFKIDFRRGRYR